MSKQISTLNYHAISAGEDSWYIVHFNSQTCYCSDDSDEDLPSVYVPVASKTKKSSKPLVEANKNN